ncbi:hypothetical protein ACUXZZ_09215 [Streptomyces graminifolii]|uniref:hypothetical protein n=1 Tax=Streptomyces graminifolii TaxID=1266771 RepID=UPI004058E3C6
MRSRGRASYGVHDFCGFCSFYGFYGFYGFWGFYAATASGVSTRLRLTPLTGVSGRPPLPWRLQLP